MWFELTYNLLGGLGLFFFGMKILSESLQAIAGPVIRKIINTLTTNRFTAVAVGTVVTTIVQSSSVTTVMVVGFVNAGLMDLTQAIGVIFGANIGTTITGWIIAIKIGKYGLGLVAAGSFPFIFSSREKFRQFGKVFIALGFVFMGLNYMGDAFKPLRSEPLFLHAIQYFTADNYLSLWACILIGTILTCIIQSSSAMLGITVALATSGAITFQTAVALVLGENIGTTITAILASVGGNTEAKRAARAHALFNVLGVVVISTMFWGYIHFVDHLIAGNPDALLEDGTKPGVATHIAAAHTVFNVVNVIIFLPFISYVARFVRWITPLPARKEEKHLKFLSDEVELSPNIAIATAEKELIHMFHQVGSMLKRVEEYVLSEKPEPKILDRIKHYEKITDIIQKEVTVYLCKAMESRMTYEESARSYALIRAADELESIADYGDALARYRDRITETEQKFTKEALADLRSYIQRVIEHFDAARKTLEEGRQFNPRMYRLKNTELKELANKIRENHQKRLQDQKCSALAGLVFSDMIVSLRKIKSHTLNIAEALSGEGLEEHS